MRTVRAVIAVLCAWTLTTPARADDAGSSALTYSPWTKFCFGGTCFVGMDGRTKSGCGPRVAAVLIERNSETKKTLRVTVPASVDKPRGASISIDRGPLVERPYVQCFANGCMADNQAGAELVDQLKQGHMLVVEATDAGNSPIRFTLPLAGFAAAYDGPSQQPKVFENQPGKLQEALRQRQTPQPPCTR
jgi:invasion protein IalB